MAFYNAVKHAIESDNGIPLARLTEQVRVTEAWGIADWWEGQAEERDRLREEISIAETARWEAEAERDHAKYTIAKLEAVIAELKGGANA